MLLTKQSMEILILLSHGWTVPLDRFVPSLALKIRSIPKVLPTNAAVFTSTVCTRVDSVTSACKLSLISAMLKSTDRFNLMTMAGTTR